MENNMIAVVNPITRVATILHKVGEVLHTIKLDFKELDEWSGFETDKQYDVHFCYDERMEFYITIYDEEIYYGGVQVEDLVLDFEYNDEDYYTSISFSTLKLQGNEQTQES
jgi:hypothetical protein